MSFARTFCCCFRSRLRRAKYVAEEDGDSGEGDIWPQWHNIRASEKYDLVAQLGEGAFSKVLVGQDKATGEHVAIKVVYRTPELKPEHWEVLQSEARVLQDCQHPYVVELRETFEEEDRLVMILELCAGRELLEDIREVKHYSEQDAARIFAQLAEAVAHIHAKGYMHRDLKPENVMFVAKPSKGKGRDGALAVKLLDFGMAATYDPAKPIRAALGTAGYLSPESCHKVPHTPAMDVWSLGVMLFVMLCGRMPYSHSQIESLQYPQIDFRMSPGYKSTRYKSLSRPARHLVLRLLERDPRERATAEEILSHPWLSFADGSDRQEHEAEAGDDPELALSAILREEDDNAFRNPAQNGADGTSNPEEFQIACDESSPKQKKGRIGNRSMLSSSMGGSGRHGSHVLNQMELQVMIGAADTEAGNDEA